MIKRGKFQSLVAIQILDVTYKSSPNFAKFIKVSWHMATQQTKFSREKCYMNNFKSFKKC